MPQLAFASLVPPPLHPSFPPSPTLLSPFIEPCFVKTRESCSFCDLLPYADDSCYPPSHPPPPHTHSSVGGNLEQLVNRPDERYCFRYMDQRVYYVSERLMKTATNFGRDNLLSMGTCVGRFTKVGVRVWVERDL